MSNKAARNLLFSAVFFFVIFLGLTFDTMKQVDKRAPVITQDIDDGKMVWQKYDCLMPHDPRERFVLRA
jgi:hypothetical protein